MQILLLIKLIVYLCITITNKTTTMKQTVKYDYNTGHRKAINDIINYVGRSYFVMLHRQLIAMVKEMPKDMSYENGFKQFAFALYIFPVEGYPILSWFKYIWEKEGRTIQ